jgi:4-amino-4-deoxy-L-arabinose transferase-like glycosyltransferase
MHASPATKGLRLTASGWTVYAWGAIALTVSFIALTYWWLTQDRSIPIYDAGAHLETALQFHKMIGAGNLLGVFNYESPYPPLGEIVGALSAFVGGVNVAAPIVGANLVFVPLLVLGCYRTGRLLFDSRAGLLAVIFVLGSPLLVDQLHVFMLDPPETALVAVAIWLLLECEDFGHTGFTVAAGVAVGAGMLIKVQFAPFVLGMVLLALLRGGWRNKRGVITFAAVALVIATPWYLDHLAQFSTFTRDASPHEGVPVGDTPATLSLANFAWYFWNILNSQFMATLFGFIAVGTAWMAVTLFRHRREALGLSLDRGAPPAAIRAGGARSNETSGVVPERHASGASVDRGPFGARLQFFVGAVVAWALITLTPAHDVRYAMPLMPYLAVIATGWIIYMPRTVRLLAIVGLLLGVGVNTLSSTFGLGGTVQLQLAHPLPAGEEFADDIRLYSSNGLLVSGPQRDGDVPELLEDLHREGVKIVSWSFEQSRLPDFSFEGIFPLLRIAKLSPVMTAAPEFSRSPRVATLVHEPVTAHSPAPCARVTDGTGVWIVRYDEAARTLALYCPRPYPHFYNVGKVG